MFSIIYDKLSRYNSGHFIKANTPKNIRIRHQLIGDDQKSVNRSSHLLNDLKEANTSCSWQNNE